MSTIETRDMGQADELIATHERGRARVIAVRGRNELRAQTGTLTGAWSSSHRMNRAQAVALRDALSAQLDGAPHFETRATLTYIRTSGMLRLLEVQGVGGTHELWLSEDGSEAVYVNAPDSGPVELLHRWARTTRDWPSWHVNGVEDQFAAQRYVMARAFDEVRAELS